VRRFSRLLDGSRASRDQADLCFAIIAPPPEMPYVSMSRAHHDERG
jgi:hypothetical protein